ncbi:hypothetical protein V8C40DRAFT_2866 [Trichoderma camerunense]
MLKFAASFLGVLAVSRRTRSTLCAQNERHRHGMGLNHFRYRLRWLATARTCRVQWPAWLALNSTSRGEPVTG